MKEQAEEGLTDLHSHLVPGVDDGARTVDESLEGLGRMVDAGYRVLATTPHFDGSLTLDPEKFGRRMEEMDEGWSVLVEAAAARYPDLSLFRGHEVMLDVPAPDLSDSRLHLADGAWVLVEWPRLQVPPGTSRVLERLIDTGVRPLIAHPERYRGIDRELAIVERWISLGAALQVNLGSLAGRYGEGARTLAFRLLRRGWVSCMGSDFHGRPHLDLYVDEARALLTEVDGVDQWRLLTSTNPGRVLGGESPLPVAELSPAGGFWNRIKGFFGTQYP